MTTIRVEAPSDVPGIRAVVERAFGQSAEAGIIDDLPRTCADCLSLVVDNDVIVAHALFSPVVVENAAPR